MEELLSDLDILRFLYIKKIEKQKQEKLKTFLKVFFNLLIGCCT